MTSCSAPISSVERVTSMLRRSASIRPGRSLDACACEVAAPSCRTATVCRTPFSSASMSPAPAFRKSPVACQDMAAPATRPEAKVPGSVSIGP